MTLTDTILRELEKAPKSAVDLAECLGRSTAEVRNALAVMYFKDGVIGCDVRGRHHLLGSNGRHANGAVIRHLGGEDVRA
jgi:hypothetical protein